MKAKRRRKGLQGALGAIAGGWLALGVLIWVSLLLDETVSSLYVKSGGLFLGLAALLWILSLPLLGWILGMICAYFWHGVADMATQQQWGLQVLLVIFILPVFGFACAYPFVVWPFFRAIEFGNDWWPKRRHRQFFGLANDWERDEDERSVS